MFWTMTDKLTVKPLDLKKKINGMITNDQNFLQLALKKLTFDFPNVNRGQTALKSFNCKIWESGRDASREQQFKLETRFRIYCGIDFAYF